VRLRYEKHYARCVTNYRAKSFRKYRDAISDSTDSYSVRSPLMDGLSPLCCCLSLPVVMRSIEIRSSVPFWYGCTCNRCAIRASVLSSHHRISYLSFHLRHCRGEESVQLNSCTVKRDKITFKYEFNKRQFKGLICISYFTISRNFSYVIAVHGNNSDFYQE